MERGDDVTVRGGSGGKSLRGIRWCRCHCYVCSLSYAFSLFNHMSHSLSSFRSLSVFFLFFSIQSISLTRFLPLRFFLLSSLYLLFSKLLFSSAIFLPLSLPFVAFSLFIFFYIYSLLLL